MNTQGMSKAQVNKAIKQTKSDLEGWYGNASSVAAGTEAFGRGAARMLTNGPMANRMTQGAMTYGTASAAAGAFENDLGATINNALGGAGLGAIGGLLAQTGGRVKPVAAMIYAGMTGPDKEMYPQEAIEDFILKVASVYAR